MAGGTAFVEDFPDLAELHRLVAFDGFNLDRIGMDCRGVQEAARHESNCSEE